MSIESIPRNQLVAIDTANPLENQSRKTLPKATGGIRNMNVIDCHWMGLLEPQTVWNEREERMLPLTG